MLSLLWPYMLLLLPLPILARWLLTSTQANKDAVRVPFYAQFIRLQNQYEDPSATAPWPALCAWLIWIALIVAASRPVWLGEAIELPLDRRDMMLAVDISGSMEERDMLINQQLMSRIDAVKRVVSTFVERRRGDRLGLILFGQQGYLQTPLTRDRATVKTQLLEALPGFAGNRTAIGDAIGLAIKKLRHRPSESRVLILLTDGANTSGADPLEAAKVAAEAGIRIHAIGIGAERFTERNIFGQLVSRNPSRDLDEASLVEIASRTGGRYFRARNAEELEQIYVELDALEPIEQTEIFRPRRSLAHWVIMSALFLGLVLGFLQRRA